MDMSQLASLLGKSGGMGGGMASQALIEFKAGRMNYDGKKVTADKRRGTVKVVKDAQGITQFQWVEAGSNNPFQNIMIFPGDAKFEKVKQSKDRVYLLEFLQSKQRHFYWMQEKNEEDDESRCKKLNNIINGRDEDAMDVDSKPSQAPKASTPSSRPAASSGSGPQVRAPSTSQPPNPGNTNYNDLLNQFLANENMSKMVEDMRAKQEESVPLETIISSSAINKILEDSKACERLYEHCPDGQQDQSGLSDSLNSSASNENLNSSIYSAVRHVLRSLQNAIELGQGHMILQQMGIDPSNPGPYSELVELFNKLAGGS